MNIGNRIYRSLAFRYKQYQRRKKEAFIANLKEKHKERMEFSIEVPFTIISSNCWGGAVYEDLGREYLTPTVGLYFFAPDFIAFLKNLKKRMEEVISFTDHSKYDEVNQFRNKEFAYPIGVFKDGVEIQFLHYKNCEEALEKWERRKQRIIWDNLFISCTDRDMMTPRLMKEFDLLPYENKVLFTAKKYDQIKCASQLKVYKSQMIVGDLYNQRYYVSRDFDINHFLKSKK